MDVNDVQLQLVLSLNYHMSRPVLFIQRVACQTKQAQKQTACTSGSFSNSIYLQAQCAVVVQHLSQLADQPRCCCTESDLQFPPFWMAAAASCFSTSLERERMEMHRHEATYSPNTLR